MKKYLIIALTLFLSACAQPITQTNQPSSFEVKQELSMQKKLNIKKREQDYEYLSEIMWPIISSNTALCPKVAYSEGSKYANLASFSEEEREIAEDFLGIGETVTVYHVYKNSPAEKAGIKKGDKIIAINGKKIAKGKKAYKSVNKIYKDTDSGVTKFIIDRDGRQFSTTTKNVKVCNYPIVYQSIGEAGSAVNAFADGKNITIARGMMRFAQGDDEMALVLSHELAHNIMNHIDKTKQNVAVGNLAGLIVDIAAASSGVDTKGIFSDLGSFTGRMAYSVDFEEEADYVGMYMMARAGYDTSKVADFWRRMSIEMYEVPSAMNTTHPANPKRFLEIQETHKEIESKIKKGQPLIPNKWKMQ